MPFTVNKKFISFFSILQLFAVVTHAQFPKTTFRGFGHLEYAATGIDTQYSYFSIGEHDFFVTSQLSPRISFLGEYVVRYAPGVPTNFLPSIERSLVKYNYRGEHAVIFGKIHTPVNYWNDVYHHGRLFFPVIDRPESFSHLVPVHTLGLQLQGQNIGDYNFGYDVVFGNGVHNTDFDDNRTVHAVTAAFHFKPIDGMRVGASYYYDFMETNGYGSHSGHSTATLPPIGQRYTGELKFQLTSLSLAYFGEKFEFLNEAMLNTTKTDSLGRARNFANFIYAGYRIADKHVPYALFDYVNVADNDLHTYGKHFTKLALGYRHEFSHLINAKVQLEFTKGHHAYAMVQPHNIQNRLKIQIAYGF